MTLISAETHPALETFTPSFDGIDWNSPKERVRKFRARVFAEHAKQNRKFQMSEFIWEADAWRDAFGNMRNDPLLAMDKRGFYAIDHRPGMRKPKHPFLKRIPDMTFGLSTLPSHECVAEDPKQSCGDPFCKNALDMALLHPNYGLMADAKWGELDLIFPFMAYEAKAELPCNSNAWVPPAEEARKQAIRTGRIFLDMQETLMRVTGRAVNMGRPVQKDITVIPQVFLLTSSGPEWCLYVLRPGEYWEGPSRRPTYCYRDAVQNNEAAQVWKGDVTDERAAWELLYQVDKIHEWATTSHRGHVRRRVN